jgi:glycosyltransferase involved in cell wall biosynthesis
MNTTQARAPRAVWIYPLSGLAFYLQPVLREFAKIFPETALYTGQWPGYVPGCEDAFDVCVVGKSRFISLRKTKTGYDRGFHWLSFKIVCDLLSFKPDIIFINGLSLWTLLVVLLKPFGRWRIVLIYSGSSPNVDLSDSSWRIRLRRLITRGIDGAITNSQAGKTYLREVLKLEEDCVFARPYQMPDKQALLSSKKESNNPLANLGSPVFLFIGQTIYRKGISWLLEACVLLEERGEFNYSIVIIGDGEQRQEFAKIAEGKSFADRITWAGWVEYGKLGQYYKNSDIFIFPTLEDIWGMVVLEAMLFAKPVLCSKWAGAEELLKHGESGFIFDPYDPKELADYMQRFIHEPELIEEMGEKARQLIAFHTPQNAAKHLENVVKAIMKEDQHSEI